MDSVRRRSILTRLEAGFRMAVYLEAYPSVQNLTRVYASVCGQRDGCQHDAASVW